MFSPSLCMYILAGNGLHQGMACTREWPKPGKGLEQGEGLEIHNPDLGLQEVLKSFLCELGLDTLYQYPPPPPPLSLYPQVICGNCDGSGRILQPVYHQEHHHHHHHHGHHHHHHHGGHIDMESVCCHHCNGSGRKRCCRD